MATEIRQPPVALPFYYGWVHIFIAARSLVIVALTSLVGNFLGGWIASKWKMNRLLALAMVLLAGSLAALPHVSTQTHVAIKS